MIKKLRLKIVCIVMAIVMVMMAVIFAMIFGFTKRNLEHNSIQALRMAADMKLGGRPGGGPERNMPCFMLEWGFDGELRILGGESYDLSDVGELKRILAEAEQSGAETGVLSRYSLRYLRHQNPMGIRYVFVDITTEQQALYGLAWICGVIGLAAFGVFLLVSILLSGWLVKPIAQAMSHQRQFVADASHELKTPLTVILTNTELLQQPEYSEDERRRFTDSILSTARQMRGLVESLLELARVDNGQIKAAITQADYSRLVENAVLPFEPVYFEKGLTLESRIEPGLRVLGNERYLSQVVGILLDNGLKYSTPGGTVCLELRRIGRGNCQLSVASPGRSMSQQELQDIFKRFYQVDKVRNMDHSYGLGLSIARQIVKEHGGRIWAESKEGINTFFVVLNCC